MEEPDNQVVGFFLTMNKQAMINTIVSRCQNFKLTYNNETKDLEDSKDFIDSMDTAKFERIIFLNSWFTKDRVQNMNQLRQVRDFLLDKVSHLENLKINLKRIDLLEECIRNLGKNANQDLVILDLVRKW